MGEKSLQKVQNDVTHMGVHNSGTKRPWLSYGISAMHRRQGYKMMYRKYLRSVETGTIMRSD